MPGGARTRTRVLAAFLAVHVALSVVGGLVAWRLLDGFLADQAARRAETVGRLARFVTSDTVRRQMEDLTGYRITPLAEPGPVRPGTVQVRDEHGLVVEVDYRNEEYRRVSRSVLAATLLFVAAGVLVFALVAWRLSWSLARPLERLAADARRIGDGRLEERPVEPVGTGEVRDLAVDLESMRRRLVALDRQHRQDERLATLGTFTAVIAHEVRNPLSAVRLTVQLLRRRHGDEPAIATIMDELERLDLIVDELLAFSRGITVEVEPCELADVARDVERLLARQAQHAGVAVAVHGAARVQADPARLRQLLLNLVLNAIQAQHGGGAVRIVIEEDGLTVEDDGPGLPGELRESAFEAFTTGRAGGTGLGLHIARAIARAHGATLEAGEGPGGRFRLAGLRPAPVSAPQEATG